MSKLIELEQKVKELSMQVKDKDRELEKLGSNGNLHAPAQSIIRNKAWHHNRILMGIPTEGLIRVEWMMHRYGVVIPINWQLGEMLAFKSLNAVGWQVADAQNVIVRKAVTDDYEWLFLLEDDTIMPINTFLRLQHYMHERKTPIVSGLYFSKGNPSEPLIFRGRGNGTFRDFKIGDMTWVDGVPTGCLLIHGSIIQLMWAESEEYKLPDGSKTRRVFETPRMAWADPQLGQYKSHSGTSDLYWCDRIMSSKVLERSGWKSFAQRHKRYPFLMDTSIYCKHIDRGTGVQYPDKSTEMKYR